MTWNRAITVSAVAVLVYGIYREGDLLPACVIASIVWLVQKHRPLW